MNSSRFDNLISAAASANGVEFALIKAIIAQESNFIPEAVRGEPQRSDASIGLMQVLLGTAKGYGYTGVAGSPADLSGLFDPETNIGIGTQFLADLLARTRNNIQDAISAYNGGFRPELGFGKVAVDPGRVCLEWSSTTKGKCNNWHTYDVGEYGNQPYVSAVMGYYYKFGNGEPPATVAGDAVKLLGVVLVLAGVVWLWRALHGGL
jgi:hypothetical protein